MSSVALCMAVRNGGDLVLRALESVIEQDWADIEIVVVDDASTDGTPAAIERRFGNAVRVQRNRRRAGQGRSLNRAISQSSAPLLKFLDHDDHLEPGCVSKLASALEAHTSAGLAFCRRRLEVAGTRADELPESLHEGFSGLSADNSGHALLEQLLANELRSNWIGEPACVMVTRAAVESVGGFSGHTRHYTDFEMWLRVLSGFDAVFVDEVLATYRVSLDSASARNAASGNDWMDRVWMLEGLCARPGMRERYPQLFELRDRERRIATRTAARRIVKRDIAAPLGPWLEYLRYRARPGRGDPVEHPI